MNLWTVIYIFIAVWVVYIFIRYFAPLRKREEGFPYVSVELDGSARELYEDEKEYLSTKFDPGDGARPYVKMRYGELTPDGRMQGYIHRRRVPFWIEIKKT
jgi:hypothetical protein